MRALKPPVFVCSRLDVIAIVRDRCGDNHARLLEFRDADGNIKHWSIPMSLLAGDGLQYRSELLSRGLMIGGHHSAHSLLSTYIKLVIPKDRLTCVNRIGWHGSQFVLPQRIFGESSGEKIVLQDAAEVNNAYTVSGTIEEWKAHIAKFCLGNPRLIFALGCAFAAPLAQILGLEGGGFHFYGRSSSGKTTLIRVASSVWGGEQYMESWRTTVNGLEGTAMLHNDTLLCLDEISQIAACQAGEAAYLIANGMGKARANVHGHRRKKSCWRVFFLSSGEKTLKQCMQEANLKIQAGQEVRIVDLPANAGKYEIFDELHGFTSGKEFSEEMDLASRKFYGAAGQAFLDILIKNLDKLRDSIRSTYAQFIKDNLPDEADGQVGRVLNRFALVATAGELATKFGITGWDLGESLDAVRVCFHDYLQLRGGIDAREEAAILERVYLFFEQHGNSRFTPFEVDHFEMLKTINRAGFRKYGSDGEEFYMFVENFRQELCKGFDPSYVARVCIRHGLLIPSSDGKVTRSEKLPREIGNTRCYRFSSKVLGVDKSNFIDSVA